MLIIAFVGLQIMMLLLALGRVKGIEEINISKAVIGHLVFTVSISVGYIFFYKKTFKNINVKPAKVIFLNKNFTIISYGLLSLGILASVATVAVVKNIDDYLYMMINYQENYQQLREIKMEFSNSGLPGFIKMWSYTPLSIFFLTSSLLLFFDFSEPRQKKSVMILCFVALFLSIVKTVFTMDRVTILGILIVLVVAFIFKKLKSSIVYGLFVVMIFMVSFLTSVKMEDFSLLEFLCLYARLGLTNFELLLEYYNNWSLGLNTIFTPLTFVAKSLGILIEVPQSDKILWDNAQYFYGYLFMDFGYLSILFLILLGFLFVKFQIAFNQGNKFAVTCFFAIIFTISTSPIIPIIRTVEIWLMVIMITFLVSILRISDVKNT